MSIWVAGSTRATASRPFRRKETKKSPFPRLITGTAWSKPPFTPSGDGAQVAQLVEHATENRSVTGSIPVLGTTFPKNPSRHTIECFPSGSIRCAQPVPVRVHAPPDVMPGWRIDASYPIQQFRLPTRHVEPTIRILPRRISAGPSVENAQAHMREKASGRCTAMQHP